MDKIEYRAVIKFLVKEGIGPKIINDRFRVVYGDSAPSYSTVKHWASLFKLGRKTLEDDPRSGRPIETTDSDMMEKIEKLIHEDTRSSLAILVKMLNIPRGSVSRVLYEKLNMKKLCGKWIPRNLTTQNKRDRVAAAHEFLELLKWNERETFNRMVLVDETWIYFHEPVTKIGSIKMESATDGQETSLSKVMVTVCWDAKGILMVEVLPTNTSFTGQYYSDQMHRLREAIKQKRHSLLDREPILLHDNGQPHKSLVAQAAIHECGFVQLHQPQSSPDLAPSDYFLFQNTKKYLKMKKFQSAEEIMTKIWEVWECKDEEWFREGINQLKQRCENVIRVNGEHIE